MQKKIYKIGLTGGIGAGKTTVARLFEKLGIPVYYADDMAKQLMQTHPEIIKDITKLLGKEAYCNKKLNTKYIAGLVFNQPELLQKLEAIVHPAVRKDFQKWVATQQAPYIILENAILEKSGMDKLVDAVILVVADEEKRIKRVKKRDNVKEQEVKSRIRNQNNDRTLLKKYNFIIENNFSNDMLAKKVKKINQEVNKMLNKS